MVMPEPKPSFAAGLDAAAATDYVSKAVYRGSRRVQSAFGVARKPETRAETQASAVCKRSPRPALAPRDTLFGVTKPREIDESATCRARESHRAQDFHWKAHSSRRRRGRLTDNGRERPQSERLERLRPEPAPPPVRAGAKTHRDERRPLCRRAGSLQMSATHLVRPVRVEGRVGDC